MQGMMSRWLYSGYNSDNGIVFTFEVNYDPGFFVVAQSTFCQVHGGGAHATGIAAYNYRDTPDGPDITVNLGDWPSWDHFTYRQGMTSTTFGIAVGANQEAVATCNLFFW
jgi:hypothetical protein